MNQLLANPAVGAIGTAIGLAAAALWLASAWWAYNDAGRRTESGLAAFAAAGWILLATPVFAPLALAVYTLVRPPVAAPDARARSLALKLTDAAVGDLCPDCGSQIETSWLRCPTCARWLTAACANCNVWSARDLDICPFCGHEREEAAADDVPAAAPRGTAQRRPASSMRPSLYAASRETSSVRS